MLLGEQDLLLQGNNTVKDGQWNSVSQSLFQSTRQSDYRSQEQFEKIRKPTFGSIVRRFHDKQHAMSHRMSNQPENLTDKTSYMALETEGSDMKIFDGKQEPPTIKQAYEKDGIFSSHPTNKSQELHRSTKIQLSYSAEKLADIRSSQEKSFFRANFNTEGITNDKETLKLLARTLSQEQGTSLSISPHRQQKLTDCESYRTQWLLRKVHYDSQASMRKQVPTVDQITLIPNQQLSEILNGQMLLKFNLPGSEHNKKLLRDNFYRFGSEIINKEQLANVKQSLMQAGYNIPLNQEVRDKIVAEFKHKHQKQSVTFQNQDCKNFQQYEHEREAHQLLNIEEYVAKMTRASSLDNMKQSNTSFYSRFVNNMLEKKEKQRFQNGQQFEQSVLLSGAPQELSYQQYQSIPKIKPGKKIVGFKESRMTVQETSPDDIFGQQRTRSLTVNLQDKLPEMTSKTRAGDLVNSQRLDVKRVTLLQAQNSVKQAEAQKTSTASSEEPLIVKTSLQRSRESFLVSKALEQEERFKTRFKFNEIGQIKSILQKQYGIFGPNKSKKSKAFQVLRKTSIEQPLKANHMDNRQNSQSMTRIPERQEVSSNCVEDSMPLITPMLASSQVSEPSLEFKTKAKRFNADQLRRGISFGGESPEMRLGKKQISIQSLTIHQRSSTSTAEQQSPTPYELATQEVVNTQAIERKVINESSKRPHFQQLTSKQIATEVNTVSLARHLKASASNQDSHELTYHKPLTKKTPALENLTLENVTISQKQFDCEQHFIDDSLRYISSYNILSIQHLDELVNLRQQFNRFDDQQIDLNNLREDSILRQFWEEHNRNFNDRLDTRSKREILFPVRSVYISFMKDLLLAQNSELARALITRFEMPEKLEEQEKKRKKALFALKSK